MKCSIARYQATRLALPETGKVKMRHYISIACVGR